jgi:tripartite-type tricarboxylate transporter receptor subunit TctC
MVALLTLFALSAGAQAQDYPNRSVKIIVPGAAGSVPDFLARTIGQRLSDSFMAPAGVPQTIIEKLHREIVAIMALPDVRERLLAQAAEPVGNRPDEYAAFIQSEIVKWARAVKEAGLKID